MDCYYTCTLGLNAKPSPESQTVWNGGQGEHQQSLESINQGELNLRPNSCAFLVWVLLKRLCVRLHLRARTHLRLGHHWVPEVTHHHPGLIDQLVLTV